MAVMQRFWKTWTERYTADAAYWYVPKGKSVADINTIGKQLKILANFEGRNWRSSQRAFLAQLTAANLSKAIVRDEDERGVPMARMLVQVFSTLGFAWTNEDEAITLTPAGEAFIAAGNSAYKIIESQSRRYQIANPMSGGKETQRIEVHPVPYLLEILLKTTHITVQEYILFCSKAKSFGDIDDTLEMINSWRKLGPKQQKNIVEALQLITVADKEAASRRSSIYNTIKLSSSYAMAFWVSSGAIKLIQKDGLSSLQIPRERLAEANDIVAFSKKHGHFISFESKKDWMAFYGNPAKVADKATALSYYTEVAQLDLVKQVLNDMEQFSEQQKRNYLSTVVSEMTVEDILEHNMHFIEPGMTLITRQLETEVGRIDLFARDKNGTYTIIELKKGKSEDDVFGQLSRYLGLCKKTKARSENVRGIIIARQIGKKLWAAADGHSTTIELMEYDLKMSLGPAQRR